MTQPDETRSTAERIADSVREQLDTDDHSRRGFLSRTALAGSALVALGGGTGAALAQEDEAEATSADFDDVAGTDLDVLNYALTLENLEDAFYQQGLEQFDDEQLNQAASGVNLGTDQTVADYVRTVGEHESAHVDVLSEAVSLLGGEPAAAGSYDFGIEDAQGFLATGQVLENTGVAAYAGAAPFIESPDLKAVALSIHSVEARHAAFLNALNGESPFPDAFDASASQEEVLDAVSGFIQSDGEPEPTETEPTGTETATPTDDVPSPTGNGTITDNGTEQ